MANIKEAIEYAKANPNSPYAEELRRRIENGKMDKELKSAGLPTIKSQNKYSLNETVEDIKQTGSNLMKTTKETFAKAQEAKNASRSGKQGMIRGFVQQAGTVLGGLAKAGGDLFTGAAKTLVPQSGEEAFSQGVSESMQPFIQGAEDTLGFSLQDIKSKYDSLDEKQKRDIDSALGLGSFLTEVGGFGLVKKPLTTAIKQTVDVAGDVTRASVDTVKNMASNINPKAVTGGVTDLITPIEKTVETTLNPTSIIPKDRLANISEESIKAGVESKNIKFQNYLKQAEKAVESNYQKTPLTLAGDKATEAANVIQNKINKQNLLKKEALGNVGDRVISNIGEVRALLRDDLRDKVGLNIITDADGISLANARGRVSKVAFDPADNKLITDSYNLLSGLGKKPTVRMIDDTVDALQDLLYKRNSLTAIPVNSQVQAVLKGITGKLNNTVKKVAGEQYTKANAKMKYMIDTFDTLNKALGKEGERGASLMKSLFSPSGEKPRRLFAEIKKLTGIDLTEEATIAKFVMENVGDARQASLLEEVIRGRTLSPTGLIEKAFEKTISKMQNPIDKAQRIIKKPLKK